jgi:hypothetical protein
MKLYEVAHRGDGDTKYCTVVDVGVEGFFES